MGFFSLSHTPCYLEGPPLYLASSHISRVFPGPCFCQTALFASYALFHLACLSTRCNSTLLFQDSAQVTHPLRQRSLIWGPCIASSLCRMVPFVNFYEKRLIFIFKVACDFLQTKFEQGVRNFIFNRLRLRCWETSK